MTYLKKQTPRTSKGRGDERGGSRGSSRRQSNEGPGSYAASRASRYQLPAGSKIDYKNMNLIQKYVTERGKIVSRRMSGISAKQQRELVEAIKRARFLGLLSVGVKRK